MCVCVYSLSVCVCVCVYSHWAVRVLSALLEG